MSTLLLSSRGVNPTTWTIPRKTPIQPPETTNIYDCDWNLSRNISNAPITISFNVYNAAENKKLAPNGTLRGTISRPIHSVLLAPVPPGVTLKVIRGYNDRLPGENCPQPGDSIADHCMNQQYGLDLVPTNGNTDIIAPATGIVD